MAKYSRGGFKRKSYGRKGFNKAVQRAVFPRPQKSLYDSDSWVKIQEVERLVINNVAAPYFEAVLCFRNDTQQVGYNRTFYGQPEFVPFSGLY